jgi:hypothetical protein
MQIISRIIFGSAITIVAALPVAAAPTFYTDKTSFIAASSALTLDDFTTPDNVFENVFAAPFTIGYPHFSLTSPLLLRTYATLASDQYSAGFLGSAQLTLAHPTTAFGFEIKSAGTAHVLTTLSFSAAGGSIDTVLSGFELFDNIQFFGVIDSAGFKKVSIVDDDSGDYLEADNALIGRSPTAVPEPAAWALMIAGFGLTGVAMRNRRRPAVVSA